MRKGKGIATLSGFAVRRAREEINVSLALSICGLPSNGIDSRSVGGLGFLRDIHPIARKQLVVQLSNPACDVFPHDRKYRFRRDAAVRRAGNKYLICIWRLQTAHVSDRIERGFIAG